MEAIIRFQGFEIYRKLVSKEMSRRSVQVSAKVRLKSRLRDDVTCAKCLLGKDREAQGLAPRKRNSRWCQDNQRHFLCTTSLRQSSKSRKQSKIQMNLTMQIAVKKKKLQLICRKAKRICGLMMIRIKKQIRRGQGVPLKLLGKMDLEIWMTFLRRARNRRMIMRTTRMETTRKATIGRVKKQEVQTNMTMKLITIMMAMKISVPSLNLNFIQRCWMSYRNLRAWIILKNTNTLV